MTSPKEPLFRCEAATLATEPFLGVSCPGPPFAAFNTVGAGDETPPDLVKRVKRVSFGIRNFDHYRIRALLSPAARTGRYCRPCTTPP